MEAEILSIGTELLRGEIVDTNSSYLASQLPLLGIDLHWVTAVDDNQQRLCEAFRRAWKHADIIITTGGLGPTGDDLTREAIADMMEEQMKISPRLEEELRSFFNRMGWEMSPSNLKQATLIPSAQTIPNPLGTAPGWWVEKEGKRIIAMPGPPREMHRMWEKEVMPRLQQEMEKEFILHQTLKVFGISESKVGEMAFPLFPTANPKIGVYAKNDGIHLRIIAKSRDQEEAATIIAQKADHLRRLLAEHLWGFGDDTMESIAGDLLTVNGLTLATMESFTGGLLANTLTRHPGSHSFYKGGFIARSHEAIFALGLDVSLIEEFGTASPQAAEVMAAAARKNMNADIGIGISEIAGSDKADARSSGTVYITIQREGINSTHSRNFPLYHPEIKNLVTSAALFELIQFLASPSR